MGGEKMANNRKAVGYVCDVPVANTGMVISKEDQRARILKCAEQENLEIIAVYEDEKYTGEFSNRPGVRKILECSEHFDVLLVERIWCFSRKMKDLKPFLDTIDARCAEVLCSSCLWDCVSQRIRHRYMEPLGERCRREAKTRAAARKRKEAA
jgi:hypothetical protein